MSATLTVTCDACLSRSETFDPPQSAPYYLKIKGWTGRMSDDWSTVFDYCPTCTRRKEN